MIIECELIVECDGCGNELSMDMATVAISFDHLDLRAALEKQGWSLKLGPSGYESLCLECQKAE